MLPNFNSSMVRLKDPKEANLLFGEGFQFLNGSIKSIPVKPLVSVSVQFQFLNGSIKSGMRRYHNQHFSISIPQWFD